MQGMLDESSPLSTSLTTSLILACFLRAQNHFIDHNQISKLSSSIICNCKNLIDSRTVSCLGYNDTNKEETGVFSSYKRFTGFLGVTYWKELLLKSVCLMHIDPINFWREATTVETSRQRPQGIVEKGKYEYGISLRILPGSQGVVSYFDFWICKSIGSWSNKQFNTLHIGLHDIASVNRKYHCPWIYTIIHPYIDQHNRNYFWIEHNSMEVYSHCIIWSFTFSNIPIANGHANPFSIGQSNRRAIYDLLGL